MVPTVTSGRYAHCGSSSPDRDWEYESEFAGASRMLLSFSESGYLTERNHPEFPLARKIPETNCFNLK